MNSPAGSDRHLILRTVTFITLGVLVVLVLIIFGRQSLPPSSPWGDLYRRAGDTYVQIFYIASSVSPRTLRDDPLLRQSLDYYRLSAEVDPRNQVTRVSRGLVLAAVGDTKEAVTVLQEALKHEKQGSGRAQVRAVVLALESQSLTQAQREAAGRAVRTLVPGPVFLAQLDVSNGDQESAEEALLAGRVRADSLIKPLLSLAAICGGILLAGLIGLVWYAVARLRRRRPLAGRPPRASWGLREAFEALVLFFVIQVAIGLIVPLSPQTAQRQPFLLLVPSVIAGIGAIAWVRRMSPGATGFGWEKGIPWRQVLTGIAAAGVMVLPVLLLGQFVNSLIKGPPAESPLVPFFTGAPNWPARLSLILGAAAVIPVVEETVFRGILYGALRRRLSVAAAIAASAVLFAVGHPHTNIIGILPYFVIGAVLAWLYERTGSLAASAAAHGAFNLFNVAVLLVLFR